MSKLLNQTKLKFPHYLSKLLQLFVRVVRCFFLSNLLHVFLADPNQVNAMFDQDFKTDSTDSTHITDSTDSMDSTDSTDSTDWTFQDTCVGQLRNSCDVFIFLYFYIALKILSLGWFFGEVLCSMERRSHSNHPPSQVQYIPQPTRLKSSSNLDFVLFRSTIFCLRTK